jgi:transcription elongation factor SPT6
LESRADLIQNEICAATVFVNCASFLRIRALHFRSTYRDSALDVLDDTRVHPEDYDLARKMAADALDLDDAVLDDDESPSLHVQELMEGDVERLNLLLLDDYAVELEKRMHAPKKICLNDIKTELMYPYKDHRRKFEGASPEEIFMMLTGESSETLYEGALVNAIVSRVKERFLNVHLPSGVEGVLHINNIEIPYGSDSDLTRLFTAHQALNTCVMKINYDRISVDLSVRKEDLNAAKPRARFDEYFDFRSMDDEKSGRSIQKIRKNKIIRTVQHPFWHAIDYKGAEKYLASKPRGDVVVRPSTKGNDHISITWKVDDGIYKHFDILEKEKPNEWTLGKVLVLNSKPYREIDQILAEFIDPMSRRIAQMLDHPKFQRKGLMEMRKNM